MELYGMTIGKEENVAEIRLKYQISIVELANALKLEGKPIAATIVGDNILIHTEIVD